MIERPTQRLYQWPGLLLTLTAVFWAGNTVAARLAIDQISPFMLTTLRWVLVAAVLWPVYGGEIRKHWGQIRPRLFAIVMLAVLGMSGFNALYYVAAHYTSAINMGILQGALPIFVLAGAFLAHGTRGGLVQLAGVLITAVGVVVVATRGEPLAILEVEFNKGDLAMLAACVLYAFYTVALRDRPHMPGAAFFTLLALIAAVTSLPLVAFEALTTGVTMPTLQGWLVTAWVAIFPSTLSQLFYLRGVDLIGPGRAGVYVNLVPVFAAVLAVVLIDEPFAAFHAVALALVIGGIWLAQRTRQPG
jgi:drug/metabolite transporter (DMT)-like permease